jgi:hypothetical protein
MTPENAPKARYKVPISLWFVEHTHRVKADIVSLFTLIYTIPPTLPTFSIPLSLSLKTLNLNLLEAPLFLCVDPRNLSQKKKNKGIQRDIMKRVLFKGLSQDP